MPFDFAQHCRAHVAEIVTWKSTVTFLVAGVSVTVPMMSLPAAMALFRALRDGSGGDIKSMKECAIHEQTTELARLLGAVSHVTDFATEPDCPYSVSIVTHDTGGAA